MTHNGPYPGQPSQPWSAGGPEEPYREPADPWGDQPDADHHGADWGGSPTSIPPGATSTSTGYSDGFAGYPGTDAYVPGQVGSPPAWTVPPTPARRGAGLPIIALVVVLGLLICGGLGTTAWLLNRNATKPTATDAATTPSAAPSSAGNAADPAPRSSNDARFVTKGQCVRNDGTPVKPVMTVAECDNGTYVVLARVDGPTTGEADAEKKCSKVRDYTKWFFYDSELDSLDFVLCLKER